MRDYLIAKRKEEKAKKKDKGKRKSKDKHKNETPEERAARKAKKREKKEKKAKKAGKSEGVRAVENLLKGLGKPDMGGRPSRSRSPDERQHRSRPDRDQSLSPHRRYASRSPEPYDHSRKRSRYPVDEGSHRMSARSGRGRDHD
jgi:RNA-binding motif X-linked protein 2